MALKPSLSGKPSVPVPAKPAPPRVKVDAGDIDDDGEEAVLITPAGIKGWVVSCIFHAILLLILGLWVFSPPGKLRPSSTRVSPGASSAYPKG